MAVKASILLMAIFTVLVAMLLAWRENRRPEVAAAAARQGWALRQKRRINRWVTAAAIAAVITMTVLGGLQWLRFLVE